MVVVWWCEDWDATVMGELDEAVSLDFLIKLIATKELVKLFASEFFTANLAIASALDKYISDNLITLMFSMFVLILIYLLHKGTFISPPSEFLFPKVKKFLRTSVFE